MEENAQGYTTNQRKGIAAAFACYALWGTLPLYWKLLAGVDTFEVIAQRIIWCFVITAAVCAAMRLDFVGLLKDARARRFLIPASLLVAVNWGVYIVAVDMGRVVEAAMGYYINPIVSIVLGLAVFKERMSPLQWAAVALCCVGVVAFAVGYGQFPWISLALALTFGAYGAVKKKGGYPAVEAIAVESAFITPAAIVLAVAVAFATGSHGFLGDVGSPEGWGVTLLLVGAGAVTALPLVLFATAANDIPLTWLGFIQYVSPTLSLLLGVFAFGEPFTVAHGVCFGCIWCGLALVGVDAVWRQRVAKSAKNATATKGAKGTKSATGAKDATGAESAKSAKSVKGERHES